MAAIESARWRMCVAVDYFEVVTIANFDRGAENCEQDLFENLAHVYSGVVSIERGVVHFCCTSMQFEFLYWFITF